MRKLALSFSCFLACASSALAHEWEHPHHDEYLTVDEARDLGFEISIDEIEWHDRETGSMVNAIGLQIEYPITITGEQIVAADYYDGCNPLHFNTIEELDDDVLPANTKRYWTDHVFPVACVGDARYWAIYGAPTATTFFWLSFELAKPFNDAR